MATAGQVLGMLCGDKEWSIIGDDYASIDWRGKAPAITESEFLAGFDAYDAYAAQKEAEAKEAKNQLLQKLGITETELQLLIS